MKFQPKSGRDFEENVCPQSSMKEALFSTPNRFWRTPIFYQGNQYVWAWFKKSISGPSITLEDCRVSDAAGALPKAPALSISPMVSGFGNNIS